jgi:uroporphyrinogen-III decarboxylase
MIGGKFHNAPIRNKIPGKDLPEDALNQIDERELFTREDYDKIAAVGWNGFWEEHYPKLSGRTMDSLTTKQNHLLKVYVDQVKVCHEQNIPVLVGVAVDSVLMAFSLCRTMTNFTMDLFEVPDKVKAAMDASCDDFIRNALETLEITKIPYAWIVLERGSAAIYRLALFEEFEWPYLQRYVDAFVSSGVTPWMHLDTDWGGNLPYFRQLPRGKCVADLDSYTDIFKAKEILRDHMCISGDVPAATLTMGSQQEVYEYCKRLIDVVGKGGGFFLTTGCECPIDAKFENVKTMVDIVNEYRGKE